MKYIIYRITNQLDGCFYIGKHRCETLDDNYFGSGYILRNAIKKYGRENFIFHLEFVLNSQEEMDLLERCVVNQDFVKRRDVYNVSIGGPNCILYGEDAPFYGRHHTEETKKLLSEQRKGMTLDTETKMKISQTLKQNYIDHPEYKEYCRSTKGKVVVNKDGVNHFVPKDKIPCDEGYVYGSKLKKPRDPKKLMSKEEKQEIMARRSKVNVNRQWYNNGIEEKWCLPEEVPEGFVLGRKRGININRRYTPGTKLKMSLKKMGKPAHNKGKINITNGSENKIICDTEEIPQGWYKGLSTPGRNRFEIIMMDSSFHILKSYPCIDAAIGETGIEKRILYRVLNPKSEMKQLNGMYFSYSLDMVYFF